MLDWPIFFRIVHVLGVVHWIGGLLFVTFVILPSLLKIEADRRLALFHALERRFAGQARISTLLVGISGFYMLYVHDRWAQLAEPLWWLDAMLALWVLFIVMLFVAEPLFVHAWFDKKARRDPDGAFRFALRGHRVLSVVSLITIIGAVGGAHGLF